MPWARSHTGELSIPLGHDSQNEGAPPGGGRKAHPAAGAGAGGRGAVLCPSLRKLEATLGFQADSWRLHGRGRPAPATKKWQDRWGARGGHRDPKPPREGIRTSVSENCASSVDRAAESGLGAGAAEGRGPGRPSPRERGQRLPRRLSLPRKQSLDFLHCTCAEPRRLLTGSPCQGPGSRGTRSGPHESRGPKDRPRGTGGSRTAVGCARRLPRSPTGPCRHHLTTNLPAHCSPAASILRRARPSGKLSPLSAERRGFRL